MRRLLLRWILLAISVAAAALVTQALGLGFMMNLSWDKSFSHNVSQCLTLLVGVAILAFLNATVGRLIKFLTLPLNCMTLGLTSLVINALLLWLAAMTDLGFTIKTTGFMGFVAALVASILISFINGVVETFLTDEKSSKN